MHFTFSDTLFGSGVKLSFKDSLQIRQFVFYNTYYISDDSPQFMFVSTDLAQTQFTGTKMTHTLAVIPITPLKVKLDYDPYSADWKRVEASPINKFSLHFHDTRGVGFSKLKLSFVSQFRTAQLI